MKHPYHTLIVGLLTVCAGLLGLNLLVVGSREATASPPGDCSPNAKGACCLPDGACIDNICPSTCDEMGGHWQGNATICAPNQCPPAGACCFNDGSCMILGTNLCAPAGGTFQGPKTVCGECRACCLPTGTCAIRTLDFCGAGGGIWMGPSTDCADFDGDGAADVCEDLDPSCPGDVTGDGEVDVSDLIFVVLEWGPCE